MKGTIKNFPEKKGLLGGRIFVLEMWLDLTKEEKQAIKSSAVDALLLGVEKDANDKQHFITLADFMKNSGPKSIPFTDAFQAHQNGQQFKSSVEAASSQIQSYITGEITREETFEF